MNKNCSVTYMGDAVVEISTSNDGKDAAILIFGSSSQSINTSWAEIKGSTDTSQKGTFHFCHKYSSMQCLRNKIF